MNQYSNQHDGFTVEQIKFACHNKRREMSDRAQSSLNN